MLAVARADVPPGRDSPRFSALGDEPARLVPLRRVPFREDVLTWWDFVGRIHVDTVGARGEWHVQSDCLDKVGCYERERA